MTVKVKTKQEEARVRKAHYTQKKKEALKKSFFA
jgi:hypothetical protein